MSADGIRQAAQSSVLALFCGEAAVVARMERALAERVAARPVDRVALPGGAWWLAEAAELSEGRLKRLMLRGRLPARVVVESLLGEGRVREVLLLGHQDCTWYRSLAPEAPPGELVKRIGSDLFRARDEIARWAPVGTRVRGLMLLQAQPAPRELF